MGRKCGLRAAFPAPLALKLDLEFARGKTIVPPAATTQATTPATSQQAADTGSLPAATQARQTATSLRRNATDDEILGISNGKRKTFRSAGQPGDPLAETKGDDGDAEAGREEPGSTTGDSAPSEAEAENLRGVLDADPRLRAAWEDAEAYRKVFATPQEAQAATELLGDLNRMDALFFSRRPEDHAQLAHAIADLDPE